MAPKKRGRSSRRRSRSSRRGNHVLIPKLVPGTRVAFGKERTPAECRARAAWEREQARLYKGVSAETISGIVRDGHLQTAKAYDWLARKREKDPVGPPS